MKSKLSFLFLTLSVLSFLFISCQKGSGTASSKYGQHKSHNHGRACFHCHGTGGDNEFWWKVGGSIYKPDLTSYNPNGTVYFYNGTGQQGALVKTLEVDGNGNIFTSETMPADSLYIGLQSSSGNVKYMPDKTNDFNCNGCHDGKSHVYKDSAFVIPRIWIK